MWIWERFARFALQVTSFAEPKNKHRSWCNIWHNDRPCNCGAG